MTTVSVSLYESLTTGKYRNRDTGLIEIFDFPGYVDRLKSYKIRRTRWFADLNWFWFRTRPVFNPNFAVLPYKYIPANRTWDYNGPLNPEFTARLEYARKAGTKAPTLNYMICCATQGPDYGSPFFCDKMRIQGIDYTGMGYPDSKALYDRADFPEYQASGAWGRLQKYYSDLYGFMKSWPARFKQFEVYNEGDPGMDELGKLRPPGYAEFTFDMPRPIPPGTKINALRRIGIERFSFHNVFTPQDVDDIVMDCANFGIDRNEIEVSTDGATPWRLPNGTYKYTFTNSQGQYKDRINWNASLANKVGVIDAHCEIRDRAEMRGVSVVDFQSVLKWSQYLVFTPDADEWYTALIT